MRNDVKDLKTLKYIWGLALAGIAWLLVFAFLINIDGAEGNGFFRFIGRFHVLVLHFPIVLIILAPALELLTKLKRFSDLKTFVPYAWCVAAVAATLTATLGLMLAANEGFSSETIHEHRFFGLTLAGLIILVAALRFSLDVIPSKLTKWMYQLSVLPVVIWMFIAAHAGGNLVRGEAYMFAHAPSVVQSLVGYEDKSKNLAWDSETDPEYTKEVQPLMAKYCYSCHGAEVQRGNVRHDVLNPDMVNGADNDFWHEVLNVMNSGEMPPRNKSQPSADERDVIVNWVTSRLKAAENAKKDQQEIALRRMSKSQYSNSLQDLLGLDIDFGATLPDDGKSELGFHNAGGILQTTPLHIEYYQSIARKALDQAIGSETKPDPYHFKVNFGEGIDPDELGTFILGFQTQGVVEGDFDVEFFDKQKRAIKPRGDQIQETELYSVEQRGSDSNRFQMQKEGMILYGALPHVEKYPKLWQAPSPNLMVQVQRAFPQTGDFRMRVEASRGYIPKIQGEYFVRSDERAKGEMRIVGGDIVSAAGAVVLTPQNVASARGMIVKPDLITAEDITDETHLLRFKTVVPKTGYYVVDLAHPYRSNDEMPSIRLSVGKGAVIEYPDLTQNRRAPKSGPMQTTIGIAYLKQGERFISAGGRFFVGMHEIHLSPISSEDPRVKALKVDTGNNNDDAVWAKKHPRLKAFMGARTDDGLDYVEVGESIEVKAPFGKSEIYTFQGRMENIPTPLIVEGDNDKLGGILVLGVWNDYMVKRRRFSGPPLLVKSIEFEGPFIPEWPTASYKSIFFDSPKRNDETAYTKAVLERFISRAYRRPLVEGEVDKFMYFWEAERENFDRYEDSVKEVLVAVLSSPSFLYIAPNLEAQTSTTNHHLASRLSYFLWDSLPDQELQKLAENGTLNADLDTQIDRMIEDDRIDSFVTTFVRDWLRLDRHDSMLVDPKKFPTLTRFVKEDMELETYEFFKEVVRSDLSIMNFIDSDFAMLNQNLAEYYGIKRVAGTEFRPVSISKDQQRGGLISQGSFLVGHSDGVHPHPIKRAVWVMDRILGNPPPPPPPNVPELDADTPGFDKLTLKQQLEQHRDSDSCRSCHQRIDPYGLVFEGMTAGGLNKPKRRNGDIIDVTSELPDGEKLNGVVDLQRYILGNRKDDFARAFSKYVYAYAIGRDIRFSDEAALDEIMEQVVADDYKVRSVFKAVVNSEAFKTGQ